MVMFLSKLNDLDLCVADIGNALLEALPKRRWHLLLYRHCKILNYQKAFYGMKSSGTCYHDKFANTMHAFRLVSVYGRT